MTNREMTIREQEYRKDLASVVYSIRTLRRTWKEEGNKKRCGTRLFKQMNDQLVAQLHTAQNRIVNLVKDTFTSVPARYKHWDTKEHWNFK